MKKNIFHHELLTPLRFATGKAKRAANILTLNQQQTLQGLAVVLHYGHYQAP
jgi:hypothetical protein